MHPRGDIRARGFRLCCIPALSVLACGGTSIAPSQNDGTSESTDAQSTSDDASSGDDAIADDSTSGDVPAGSNTFSADSLSGGWAQTCARDDAGELFCWGRRFADAVVDESIATPTAFSSDRWHAHAIGQTHACAVREDGTLWCWGRNCAGQLGDGTRDDSEVPIQVGDSTHWIDVAAGGGHSCAIDDTGALSCWGGLDYGQSKGCDEMPSLPPTTVDGTWVDVSAHYYSIHAVRSDGTLWRMLDAPWGDAGEETQLAADTDWGDAIALSYHGCATKMDGSLWCWGRNDSGQLGVGTKQNVDLPTRVGGEVDWVAVSAGYGHSCGVRAGAVHCWGGNAVGELGAGDLPLRSAPTRVGESDHWSAPTLGSGLSCANDDETWKCWGRNSFGQLGFADDAVYLEPFALEGSWTAVRAISSSLCGVDDAQHLWCWGNTTADRVELHPGTTFVSDGLSQRCALDEERHAWCYPDKFNNSASELVATVTWNQIASGSFGHRCGITTEGALLCWGENASGQLGTGIVGGSASTPQEVAGGGSWRSVSVWNEAGTPTGASCGIRDEAARCTCTTPCCSTPTSPGPHARSSCATARTRSTSTASSSHARGRRSKQRCVACSHGCSPSQRIEVSRFDPASGRGWLGPWRSTATDGAILARPATRDPAIRRAIALGQIAERASYTVLRPCSGFSPGSRRSSRRTSPSCTDLRLRPRRPRGSVCCRSSSSRCRSRGGWRGGGRDPERSGQLASRRSAWRSATRSSTSRR